MTYDVIIVGAGPAGIFTALKLIQEKPLLQILILEKGFDLEQRFCPMKEQGGSCQDYQCSSCSIVSGWGGAGAFSDGKLTLSPGIGGNLVKYLGEEELMSFIQAADETYLRFGAPREVYAPSKERLLQIKQKAVMAELELVPSRVRHLGTGHSTRILKAMRDYLKEQGVTIRVKSQVEKIRTHQGQALGVEMADGTEYSCSFLSIFPGRENSEWMSQEAARLKLPMKMNPVDIGVRVEVPSQILEDLTQDFYELKFLYNAPTFDDQVRTFCMCPYGEVVNENNQGLYTVNGHSHSTIKTSNTNFALLVSKTFTEPFKEPITYGRYIARLANLLGGGILVQRLGDLLSGRRSNASRIRKGLVEPTLKDATPGDLSLVLPYRHLLSIIEMLKALDALTPGIYSRHTLLYGVEVKFYSSRIQVNQDMETHIENLYVGGDGAGITRGLIQASASGFIIARNILKKITS